MAVAKRPAGFPTRDKMVSLFGDGIKIDEEGNPVDGSTAFRFFAEKRGKIVGDPIQAGGSACPNEDSFCTYDADWLYIACRGECSLGLEVSN